VACCLSKRDSSPSARPRLPSLSQHSVEEVLRSFRQEGHALLRGYGGKQAELWDAGCELVQRMFLGLRRQHPTLGMKFEVERDVQSGLGAPPDDRALVLRVALDVAPLRGEVATRSRLSNDIVLQRDVCIWLIRPLAAATELKAVALGFEGVTFETVSEIASIRQHAKKDLGADFNRESLYSWWERNKAKVAPFESSKLRRVIESMNDMVVTPTWVKKDVVWLRLNSVTVRIAGLEFLHGSSGITTYADITTMTESDRVQTKLVDDIMRGKVANATEMALGMKLAASGTNLCRAWYGKQAGVEGACVWKFMKLFTAAEWWGPGSDGWHRFDHSWLAVDRKDRFGRVQAEHGRLIWHLPTPAGQVAEKPLSPVACTDTAVSRCACRRRHTSHRT